jgi:RND family efflux transporter MFP subunit
MDDKASLLAQLRIDRTDERTAAVSRTWPLWVGGALVLLAIAALAAWLWLRPRGVPVRVAVAREVTTQSGSGHITAASALDASGYVVARREATVSAKTIGRVLEVLVEEGQRVDAGQVVARLDDSNSRAALEQTRAQLAQSEAGLKAAKIAFDDATPIYQRMQRQSVAAVISAQDFDQAKATFNAAEQNYLVQKEAVESARAAFIVAQRYQDDTIVRAPFAGVVTDKAAQPGEIVSPQTAGGGGFTRTGICTIVDMDSLEAEVDVSENFINRVHPGQPATVKLNAYPDWEIPASVIAVIPTADRSKATVKVRVGFKVKDPRILPEMGTRVSFLSEANANAGSGESPAQHATVLPSDAVQANGDTGVVFVVNGNHVERRTVRLGGKTSEGQQVLSGISPGERVAIADFSRLVGDDTKVYVQD